MRNYLDLMKNIRDNGVDTKDRTGTGCRKLIGQQLRFDLLEGFPLMTTKKIFWKSVVHELLWFLSGDTNTEYLRKNGIKIWDEWADENGDLGPIYGAQWRRPFTKDGKVHDQIKSAIHDIKNNSDSRRIIVNSWNVEKLDEMRLPPCHCFFQIHNVNGNLSLCLTMRSADIFLGVPFNIASYALLLKMIAYVTNTKAQTLVFTMNDCHIYSNHLEQVDIQLARHPRRLPIVVLEPTIKDIDDFRFEHVELINYRHDTYIKAPVSV